MTTATFVEPALVLPPAALLEPVLELPQAATRRAAEPAATTPSVRRIFMGLGMVCSFNLWRPGGHGIS
jgi:hypothetical protein